MDGDGNAANTVDVSSVISEVSGHAYTALAAAVAIGTALLGWQFIKRFIKKA